MSIPARTSAPVSAGVFAWLLPSAAPGPAQTAEGLWITVPNPITSDAVARIKGQISSRLDSESPRPKPSVVIFDFNPSGKPAATAEIGACRDLAQLIKSRQGQVNTVAFVHAKVSGHTVLPVLACKELVMSKDAAIGEIAGENIDPLQEPDKATYKFYFDRDAQFALVRKMYDRDVKLVKGTDRTTQKPQYADASDPAVKNLVGMQEVTGVPVGTLALYGAPLARDVGLCRRLAETRPEVAEAYGLPPTVCREDPLGGRAPDAYRWALKGDVDG